MGRWELLETFVKSVECGSLTLAAERLGVSRSLVSRHISQLETHLGTQLLFRTTRKIRPTDAGSLLFQKCERLFAELDEAEQSVTNRRSDPKGLLRIVCTDILGERHVTKAATRFCMQHKDIQVEIDITMRDVDLVAEGYDLAVRYGNLESSTYRARKVTEFQHILCAAPSYLDQRGLPKAPEDLVHHNCLIATFIPCATWYFRISGSDIPFKFQGNLRSNTGTSLITSALEGLGVCWLPELYVQEYLQSNELVPLLQSFQAAPMPVWMIYPDTRHVPAKVRLFIDYFAEFINEINIAGRKVKRAKC